MGDGSDQTCFQFSSLLKFFVQFSTLYFKII